jgi:hypothetical protein
MNLAELVNRVYQAVGDNTVATALIVQNINDGIREIGRLINAPSADVRVAGVIGPFAVTVRTFDGATQKDYEVEYSGIREVYAYRHPQSPQSGRRIPLYTTSEASLYHPEWHLNAAGGTSGEGPEAFNYTWHDGSPIEYIVYDPANVSAPLLPLPRNHAATDLYIKVQIKPKLLKLWTDVPFEGDFESSHEAVSEYAAFKIVNMLGNGSEQAITKGTFHYNRFKQLVDQMLSDKREEPVMVQSMHAEWSDW